MRFWNKNRIFFNILLLISLAGFLVFPNICSADDFDNFDFKDIDQYLELSQEDTYKIISTLKQVLTTEGISLWSSGYVADEKIAAAIVLLNVVRVEVLNHLLVDAPIEVTKKIIKGAIEIYQFVTAENIGIILEKLEKESVQMAVDYGLQYLIQEELKVAPGAIKLEYPSNYGGKKKVIFQYIIVYKPIDIKKGEVLIKFYSPNLIEPPDPSKFSKILQVPDLQDKLPPFVVEIKGIVEKNNFDNYQWINKNGKLAYPLITIDFPPQVPDLGIKPLTVWQKHFLKPIQTAFREVEIIITKVTRHSLDTANIWDEIKSFFSKINPFSPAAVIEIPEAKEGQSLAEQKKELLTVKETIEGIILETSLKDATETESQLIETEPKIEEKLEMTLEELQEMLDDIAERIDVLNQKTIELAAAKMTEAKPQSDYEVEMTDVELEKTKVVEEEKVEEEIEELEQAKQRQEGQEEIVFCEKTGYPARSKVIFNEIAWMGTENSANDEWIELKNISGSPIDLTSWQLIDKDEQIKIIFNDGYPIPISEFLLLERTNDESVPEITADLIYTGGLGNMDEALYLFDENCQLQDKITVGSEWPSGNNSSKRTMERKTDLNWQTSLNPGGTPKQQNSSGYTEPSYGGGGGSGAPSLPPEEPEEPQEEDEQEAKEPVINLSYPEINPVNKEIKVELSAANFKDVSYDVKISIEKDGILSEIYNQKEDDWQSSFSYIDDVVIGPAVQNELFRLRIKKEQTDFRGDAEITAKLRETGHTEYIEFTDKIQISGPSTSSVNQSPIASFIFSPATSTIGEKILFNAASSTDEDGTITSYIWDFGDDSSTTSVVATTTHFYSTSSEFIISLQVLDNEGATSSLTTSTIFINEFESEPEPEEPEGSVTINEIAWMGTSVANSADEWIELYNNTENPIELNNWTLSWTHGTTTHSITFSTSTIPALDFFLLERSDDNTIPDIPAGQIFTGALSNDGEKLELRDASSTLIDVVDCTDGWFAGTTTEGYISMERINSNASRTDSTNWASNNLITRNGKDAGGNSVNGTPKEPNSVSVSPTTISSLPFNEFENITLTYLGNPYIINNTILTVPQDKTLIIEPGVTLKFNEDHSNNTAGLEVEGILKAIGEGNKKIVFTTLFDALWSSWYGIHFTPLSVDSELNWTEIRYGNRKVPPKNGPTILVENTSIILRNSALENYYDKGLKLINSSSTIENVNFSGMGPNTSPDVSTWLSTAAIEIWDSSPIIRNCDLIEKNEYGIFINSLTSEDTPIIEGNNFENNEKPIFTGNLNAVFENNRGKYNQTNGIFVLGDINENIAWYKNDIPYIINTNRPVTVKSGGILTINPGVVVKGYYKAYLKSEGKLIAEGTSANPIVFTSYKDDSYGGDTNNDGGSFGSAKDWGGIIFVSSSGNSIFKNVIVRYGGGQEGIDWMDKALVWVGETTVEIDNLTAEYGSKMGLFLKNSRSTVKNSHFGNNEHGLEIYSSEDVFPQIGEGLTFENNTEYDIFIHSNDIWCPQLPVYLLATPTSSNCGP